jgi:hypothetical protein
MIRRSPVIAVLALSACGGGTPDPCDGEDTCIAITLTGDGEVDQLRLDLVYGFRLGSVATPTPPTSTDLPLVVPILLGTPTEPLRVGVVIAALRDDAVIGYASGEIEVAPLAHAALDLELGPVVACPDATVFCASPDAELGVPGTVYECRAGDVPRAHGRCPNGCTVDRTACDAGPQACVGVGYYCGGDKLEGDPQLLYHCEGAVAPRRCDQGCRVMPEGHDDCCLGDPDCGPLD